MGITINDLMAILMGLVCMGLIICVRKWSENKVKKEEQKN